MSISMSRRLSEFISVHIIGNVDKIFCENCLLSLNVA